MMRFAVEEIPASAFPRTPRIGDVYAAKGGGAPALWVLVALSATGQSGHYLGLSDSGEIVSTASYANHAMRSRALVGRADLAEMVIAIRASQEATP